eukprot:TRINITY_DN1058_c0_g1_i1.p1 TRINITY_DN1058_c0_g1~~TRINITY_DN1058_c0_g1_i1.p1  ORF type:complete len:313 (-),score=76.70 TRINITY_DN1058_c0_g1_i1:236-1174(-)
MNDLFSKSFSFSKARNYVDLKRESFRDGNTGNETEMAKLETERDMKMFFDEVDLVKNEMAQIRQVLLKLQDANEESKTIHKASAMKALRDRMDKDIEAVSKLARSIKQKLEDLDKANLASRRIPGCEEGSPHDRTRTNITNAERKKLKDLMGDFQVLRQKIMGEYRDTVERRYYTVTGQKADEATIEHIIETGESENFLQKAIQEQGRGQVLETIKEIQERHDAVKDIEKSLLELHQIFLDMSVLVEEQGSHLDDIEAQVGRASSFIQRGTTQLRTAKKHQRSSRKWMCIGIIILLVILLIIIIPIIVTLRK